MHLQVHGIVKVKLYALLLVSYFSNDRFKRIYATTVNYFTKIFARKDDDTGSRFFWDQLRRGFAFPTAHISLALEQS